ncbi:MAG: aquaporin family protein [Caldilineaceae bacterium]|nr:aquaporin family protein [Caldilineaceae bacterium]
MKNIALPRRLVAELIGTAFLLATVVGSGIMGERLAGGNVAIALLANTIPTGAILVVLINMLGPISGAHFNPAVTAIFTAKREMVLSDSALYVLMQIVGGLIGVWVAHLMFEEVVFQTSAKMRTGPAQWLAEWVATFGLVFTILTTLRVKESAVAMAVGLYITAAYWFTASTSFANPAVTVARAFTNTFAGIRPGDIFYFIVAQLLGAFCALWICLWLLDDVSIKEELSSTPAET